MEIDIGSIQRIMVNRFDIIRIPHIMHDIPGKICILTLIDPAAVLAHVSWTGTGHCIFKHGLSHFVDIHLAALHDVYISHSGRRFLDREQRIKYKRIQPVLIQAVWHFVVIFCGIKHSSLADLTEMHGRFSDLDPVFVDSRD